MQPQIAKRPPRFYVPEKDLQHSQPGATFQLGKEETHHALKYVQTPPAAGFDVKLTLTGVYYSSICLQSRTA